MSDNIVDQSYNTVGGDNLGYNSSSALQLRLDTTRIIEDIEMFLSGSRRITYIDPETKDIFTKTQRKGKPKANEQGVHAIMAILSSTINPSVVQGNFPADGSDYSPMYEAYIYEFNEGIATTLMNNLNNWEIEQADYDVIIDFIMMMVIPFFTRLIKNKERESYEHTVRHTESNTVKEGGGGFALFGKKGGG